MILLKTLQLINFISHENTTISFNENEQILLDGKSGSGKSSITEAILWALYGKGRSENRNLVRRGTKTASASLKLIDGEQETLITRTVSAAGKNTLTITQNTGSLGQFLPIERVGIKDLQDWIEKEFLKASYELFTNSVAYPQENENSFVKANASRRKDLLLEIVRAENFDELYDKTRNAITASGLDSAVTSSKIEGLKKTIEEAEVIEKKHDSYEKEASEGSVVLQSLNKSHKELELKSSSVGDLTRQIKDKEVMLKMLSSSIETIESQLENDKNLILEYHKIDIDKAKKDVEEAEKISLEIASIEKEIQESILAQQKLNAYLADRPNVTDNSKDIEILNDRLIPLIKETGKCPAGDDCPFVIPIKGQIDFLGEQIEAKTKQRVAEEEALTKWELGLTKLPLVKDYVDLYGKLNVLRETVSNLLKSKDIIVQHELFQKSLENRNAQQIIWTKKIAEDKASLLSTQLLLKELELSLQKIDVVQINSELSNIILLISQMENKVQNALVGVKMAQSATETIKTSQQALQALTEASRRALEDVETLELLKEALSPRGVKAVVIDYLVPQLEDKINIVLGQMSDFRIRLDTQKPLADDEGVKEGLFIIVINDRKEELPFQSYSGGEKVKITVAISEALASLMSGVGFRIMDENIVSLDSESTEGFVEVLVGLQQKFPQLLIISHLQDVKDIFEKKISIAKINGISKIMI